MITVEGYTQNHWYSGLVGRIAHAPNYIKGAVVAGGVAAVITLATLLASGESPNVVQQPIRDNTNMPVAASPIRTPTPTETPKPDELSFFEKYPNIGSISSVSEIRGYTRMAMEIGWKGRKVYEAGNTREADKLYQEAVDLLMFVNGAIKTSEGDDRENKDMAASMVVFEWLCGGSVPERVITELQDDVNKGPFGIDDLVIGAPYGVESMEPYCNE